MSILPILARWEGIILLGGLFALIFWKLVTGGISLNQLLEGDIGKSDGRPGLEPDTYVSAGRTQSLATTIFAALYYLLQFLRNPTEFPQLPTILVGVVMGSQAIYLAYYNGERSHMGIDFLTPLQKIAELITSY